MTAKQEDDSIPTRASKGKKSKKACRDEVRLTPTLKSDTSFYPTWPALTSLSWVGEMVQIAAQVKNDMHEIATKYDFKVGKFLVFRPPETIDELRSPLALHPCISPAGRPLV